MIVPRTNCAVNTMQMRNPCPAQQSANICVRLWLQLLLGVLAQASSESNSNLQHLLFYTCATKEVKNQCEESFTLDQAGIANNGFTNNTTLIEEGFAKGITSLFAVHDVFFVNKVGLRKDWKIRWNQTKLLIKPLIKSKKVVGIFLGDELISGGKITFDDFNTSLSAVVELKEEFPDLFTWLNEGGTSWVKKIEGGKLPMGLDVISIDDYSLSVDEHRSFYHSILYPLMEPHQAAWLVPGSYGTGYNISSSRWCGGGDTLDACDMFMTNRTDGFLQWAQQDSRISGFAPWHWDTRTPQEVSINKEIGTVDMPRLKAKWEEIATIVRANSRP